MDEDISWKPHIQYELKKLSQGVGVTAEIRKYLNNKNIVPLYYVFSTLIYYTVF